MKCESLLGLSLNAAVDSCVDNGCRNRGQCLAFTKGVYSYAACRCVAGNYQLISVDSVKCRKSALHVAVVVVVNLLLFCIENHFRFSLS